MRNPAMEIEIETRYARETRGAQGLAPAVVAAHSLEQRRTTGKGRTRGLGSEAPPPNRFAGELVTTDPVARTRRCPTCRAWLPFAAYSLNRRDAQGIQHICASCQRAYQRRRAAEAREALRWWRAREAT